MDKSEAPKPFNLDQFLRDLKLQPEVKRPEGRKVPAHYVMAIEPIEYIDKNGLDFIEGNVIKYVSRYRFKDGLKDLKKAKDYLEMLIKRETDG